MSNLLEVKKHWNHIGSNYHKLWHSYSQKEMSKMETDLIEGWVKKKKSCDFLDFGIGNGRIIDALIRSSINNASIYGIDISNEMISFCIDKFSKDEKVKKISLVSDLNNIHGVYNQYFDFITSIRVIKYNSNWQIILKQLLDNLKPDGVIIFSMPNSVSLNKFLKADVTYIRASVGDIRKILRDNKCEILEIRGFSRLPDFLHNIDNYFVSRFLNFFEKMLSYVFGKHLLCREVFYVCKKD